MRSVWMDAVCRKGEWDVVSSFSPSGNLQGILVYHVRTILGIRFILMPPLCFYNGIKLFYPDEISDYEKQSFENKLISELIEKLPKHAFYYQQFHPEFQNWAPMYWKGFNQSTRYTYRIELDKSLSPSLDNLKGNLRRNIQKAETVCDIKEVAFDEFCLALKDSYSNRSNPFNIDLLKELHSALSTNNLCSLKLCYRKNSMEVHAGSMVAFDKKESYYVCGFYNPKWKDSGAMSYLLWHEIINRKTKVFDFEGSMIKDVEHFFRAFNARWTPHFRIWKTNSKILSPLIRHKFRNILHG